MKVTNTKKIKISRLVLTRFIYENLSLSNEQKPVLTKNAVEVYMVFLKTKVWALKIENTGNYNLKGHET